MVNAKPQGIVVSWIFGELPNEIYEYWAMGSQAFFGG